MSAADLTRLAIVSSLKEVSEKKSFEKITVIEIAKQCDISRNTVYYYFKDKYDVLEWIFHMELEPILAPFMPEEKWPESIIALCEHMKKEKGFYMSALNDPGPRGLYQLLVNYYKQSMLLFAKRHYERMGIKDSESQEVIARFYSHAMIGLMTDWARAGMKKDPHCATRIIQLAAKERLFAGEYWRL